MRMSSGAAHNLPATQRARGQYCDTAAVPASSRARPETRRDASTRRFQRVSLENYILHFGGKRCG